MNNLDLHYFFHGLVILMVGLLGGFPFARAIKNKTGKEVAWRVVHSGSSVAGTMLIAIGAVIRRLEVSELLHSVILWGIVISTYLFVFGMVVAAISGERGIGKNPEEQTTKWKFVYYLYGIGAVVSIISVSILIMTCAFQLFMP